MIGIYSVLYWLMRFCKTSMLSSVRPEVLPRSMTRSMRACSSATKWRTPASVVESDMASFHPYRLSSLRGNPSTRNLPAAQPFNSIAFFIRPHVMATGTIAPSAMILAISSAVSEPVAFSARSKSPADKCTNP